eukprot:Em0005g1532a
MSSKVKVAVRVRPLNKRELDIGTNIVVDMDNNQTILLPTSTQKTQRTFAFDHCFWTVDEKNPKFAGQEVVFAALGVDVLNSAFEGYNACIFAYGQTGSGKSYTMMGAGSEEHQKGIIPRLCDTMFGRIDQNTDSQLSFTVEVSYMEIYNEKVRDLLNPKGEKHHLKVREHLVLGPYVENLSKLAVRSFSDINDLMSEGNKSRTVAATQMNAESSRSHAVFSIVLTQTSFDPATQSGLEKVSKVSLVDLAGSERVSKTGAEGDRLKEGSNINKSLTTLGIVISALADQGNAAKKGKSGFVPYRDSTLTWLLKDNLGGNSRTVMVATISPAEDNYEETLSTLRYADRAKKIVNHAVINEDPNSRVIRELREEVEKLRLMLTKGGGEEGPVGAGNQELTQLKDKLKISETLMTEMSKSWEQKLAETERIHKERQKTLENMGISVQASGIGVQADKFYLVNLNADPTMNELLVCYLKDLTRVGRPNAEPPQDIQLQGLGITNEHCIIELVNREVFLTPMRGSRTLVNGIVITDRTQLRHGGRILLGNNHLFRLNCPGQSSVGDEPMGYEQAMKEISHNELIKDPLYCKMQQELAQKHEAEKEGALEAQKAKYEKELALLKEQLESANLKGTGHSPEQPGPTQYKEEQSESIQTKERIDSVQQPKEKGEITPTREQQQEPSPLLEQSAGPTVAVRLPTVSTPVLMAKHKPPRSLEEEWEERNHALHKDTVFKVTLTVPVSFLSPHKKSTETSNEVAIRVLHKQHGTDHVWSLDTLHEKVLGMREMYQRMEEGSSLLDATMGAEPFYDLEQHALLGVANVFLECLHHSVPHDYPAPIIAPTGMECGKLRVILQRIPSDSGDEVDTGVLEVTDDEESELRPGMVIRCQVTLVEAVGLPKEYCHYMFCQYKFWGENDATIIPPLLQQDKLPDGVQRFNHTKVVKFEVTEEFLEFLDEGVLSVEVWGHRRSGFSENGQTVEDKSKTFSERWAELTSRLEVWVDIMELNDMGEYYPVEMQGKQDVMTGGIFMIKQGQSRRVRVTVTQATTGSRLKMDCITSIAIGSIHVRNRLDDSLDSYQELDLERLRSKWTEALMCRRDYLDAEVRKLMDKKEQSAADLEKQNELLDQWAMLQWQRSAVLQPKAGSGIPGAPNNWHFEPGKELRAPVLFLDLNDDLETPCDDDPLKAVKTGELMGEKEETMMDLPLIKDAKKEEKGCVKVQASWDSTVHDTNSLNRITNDKDRVFAIVKISVRLKHPPGITLVLRKRICLRVYKKPSVLGALFRSFTGPKETRNGCGVIFEVVTGIPKLEGMNKAVKIPANPSFVELKEDDNAVEKFKKAMYSISNILALDKLKQEVSLKEKLASTGKTLRTRYTHTPSASPPPSSPALSRTSSGVISQSEQLSVEREMQQQLDSTPTAVMPPASLESQLPDEESGTVGGVVFEKEPDETEVGREATAEGDPEGEHRGVALDVIPEEGTPRGTPDLTMVGGAGGESDEEGEDQSRKEVGEEDEHEENKTVEVTREVESLVGVKEGEVKDERTGEGLPAEVERVALSADETVPDHTEKAKGAVDATPMAEDTNVVNVTATNEEVKHEANLTTALVESEPAAGGQVEGRHATPVDSDDPQGSDPQGSVLDNLPSVEQASNTDPVTAGSASTPASTTISISQVLDHLEEVRDASQSPQSSLTSGNTPEPQQPERRRSEGDAMSSLSDQRSPSPSQQFKAVSSSTITPRVDSPLLKRELSPTPSNDSESSSDSKPPLPPPPFNVGDKVMVESNGFKFCIVKYIGTTEFAPGEWVGVALEKPLGKHNGTVQGVKYFKCKDGHGVFVKRDKILHNPVATSSGAAAVSSGVVSPGASRTSSSPLVGKRISSNPYSRSYAGARRLSGPGRRS